MMRRFGAVSTAPPAGSTTASLLHFDGADGSTVFTDETGKVWTPTAGPTIDAANKKYGTGCGKFPYITNANGYLTTPYSDDFAFGSGDFTIQFWVRWISTTPYYGPVICLDSIGGTRGWRIVKGDTTNILQFAIDTNIDSYVLNDSGVVPTASMAHYAWVRDGSMLRLYRNGVQVASRSISGSANAPNVPCVVGALWALTGPVNNNRLYAYLDDLKVEKGFCQYPGGAAFSPPPGPLAL